MKHDMTERGAGGRGCGALAGMGCGGLVLLAFLAGMVLWLPVWDTGPVEDADMFTEWTALPAEANALPLFTRDLPELERVDTDRVMQWRGDPEGHAEEIAAFFEATEEHMQRLEAILAVGAVQEKRVESFADELHTVSVGMDLNRVLHHRIHLMSDPMERLALLGKYHRFTRMMGEHVDSLIHALVAVACETMLLDAMRVHLLDEQIPEADLAVLEGMLEDMSDLRAMFAEAYRSEYRVFSNTLAENFSMTEEDAGVDWVRYLSSFGYFFHPNRTRGLYVESVRGWIRDVERREPWGADEVVPWENEDFGFERNLGPNILGKLLLNILTPATGSVVKRMVELEAERAGLRVAVALHRYRRDRGEWPEGLEDLVPEFLEAVPADPFDGEALRYDRERRVVYSVGPDRVDQGGMDEPPPAEAGKRRVRGAADEVFAF